jgi:dihydroorotase
METSHSAVENGAGTKPEADIFLKDGEIIDPGQGINGKGSIAIKDSKIQAIGPGLASDGAKVVLDMRGKILVPGLIDVHCHPAAGFSWLGVPPDEFGLHCGVTMIGDGGTSGAANFEAFRKLIIEPAKTEIFAFLNIAKAGLITLPEIHTSHDIDVELSRRVVEANRGWIKGIKIRVIEPLAEGIGIQAVETAKKLADGLNLPLMMHIGEPRDRMEKDGMDDFSRQAVSLLDEGDILSHFLTWEPGGMILKDGTIYPELEKARGRGVYLDSCHGLWHFNFTTARLGLARGFKPSLISTDLSSVNTTVVQSLPVTLSKFLNLGLQLEEIIAMATINPAKALREENQRGSLKPGMPADITVLETIKGDFLFGDGKGRESLRGNLLLEPRMVFKKGEMRPAYSRYQIPPLYD